MYTHLLLMPSYSSRATTCVAPRLIVSQNYRCGLLRLPYHLSAQYIRHPLFRSAPPSNTSFATTKSIGSSFEDIANDTSPTRLAQRDQPNQVSFTTLLFSWFFFFVKLAKTVKVLGLVFKAPRSNSVYIIYPYHSLHQISFVSSFFCLILTTLHNQFFFFSNNHIIYICFK